MALGRSVKEGLAYPVNILTEEELELRETKLGPAWPVYVINPGGGSGGGDADTLDGQDGVWYRDRANHTGTQTASTISDFDTQVQTNGLDELAAPVSDVDINNQKLINVATPTDPNDAVNKSYVDSIVISGGDADTLDGQDGSYYLDRANHTGTQVAATISDFDAQVQTNQLDELAAPTTDLDINNNKLINVSNPTNSLDAANKQYVDDTFGSITLHPPVKVATTEDITLSGEQLIDGVDMFTGDRILVKDQIDTIENGIYIVDTGAWTRASDADIWEELVSAFVFVIEGAEYGDTGWLCTADPLGTIGVDSIIWIQFTNVDTTAANVGGGEEVYKEKVGNELRFRTLIAGSTNVTITENADDITVDVPNVTHKYAANIGNGVNTSFTINHNLNSIDVVVTVRVATGTMAVVYPEIVIQDVNNVVISFTLAPSTDEYRVVVIG